MARRGALTALQAVLAGVSGGAQGYVQQRELERKRQQDVAAQEERQALNLRTLQNEGFMTPEAFAKQQERQATQGSGLVQRSILGALSPMSTAAAPAPTASDVNALSAALATAAQPAQRLKIYGQELVRAESPLAREERLGLLAQERQTMATREAQRTRAAEQQADRELQTRLTNLRIQADKEVANIRARASGDRPPPKPTDAQEKSFQFAQRMAGANDVIEKYGPKARLDRVTAMLAAENPAWVALLNRSLTPEEQQLVTAIRQFSEPILRKNTGAAFNRQEIRWVEQQVIPLSGDSQDVQEYKSGVRQREIGTMQALATPATMYYEWATGSRPSLSTFEEPQ